MILRRVILNQTSNAAKTPTMVLSPLRLNLLLFSFCAVKSGATRRDRTGDLLITNQPLYQLS